MARLLESRRKKLRANGRSVYVPWLTDFREPLLRQHKYLNVMGNGKLQVGKKDLVLEHSHLYTKI